MQIFERRMPNDFDLWCIGDLHVGTLAHAAGPLKKCLAEVKKDKRAYVIGMADYVEGRSVDHPYFDWSTTDVTTPIAYKQAEVVIDYFMPIKNKIICLLEGNHDRYSRNYIGLVENVICRELGIPFGNWGCVINFIMKNGKSFHGLFIHGSDRRSPVRSSSEIKARKRLNEKLSLIRILSAPGFSQCLINCCAHYHRLITYKPSETTELSLIVKNGDIHESYRTPEHGGPYIPVFERYYACTGSWLKSYMIGMSTYGERAMYEPTSLGAAVFIIRKGKVVDIEERTF